MASTFSQLLSLTFLAFALCTNAWPSKPSKSFIPPNAKCEDYTIPVTVTSENYPWVAPTWNDDFEFIDFASTATSRLDAGFPPPIGKPVTETASYEIAATYCTPKKPNDKSKTVLLATHGLGFDRSYWNSAYKPNEYNFVQYAIAQGYSVFFYDRLGVGASTKISGFKNQLNIQTAILTSLATSLRHGHYTSTTNPTSIILIGHSFGSFLTNSVAAAAPKAADAVILTGYGLNGSDTRLVLQGFAPRVAREQDANKFAAFDPGYITTADIYANINNFFKSPAYEHDVAAFSEATKQPFAIAELVSLTPELLKINAAEFKGPALVISGERDWILCGGYLRPGELERSFAGLFGGSERFETYVQPRSGHGLNFARNATGFYGEVFGFLGRSGF